MQRYQALNPVSYTHLDVYKRQLVYYINKSFNASICFYFHFYCKFLWNISSTGELLYFKQYFIMFIFQIFLYDHDSHVHIYLYEIYLYFKYMIFMLKQYINSDNIHQSSPKKCTLEIIIKLTLALKLYICLLYTSRCV